MLPVQRDVVQKFSAFCSVGAFFCKTFTFKKDLNEISRRQCDREFNAVILKGAAFAGRNLGQSLKQATKKAKREAIKS